MVELGTVWLLMVVLNQDPGPAYLSGDISIQSFKPEEGMSTVSGKAAFDLSPGKEKVWAELTTTVEKKKRHRIVILRFDEGKVYRLDPETKTYAEGRLKDPKKTLEQIRKIYLGGPDGKKRAKTVRLRKEVTETRVCRKIETGSYTTMFYVDEKLEGAVTRIDVSSNKGNFAVVNKLEGANVKEIPASRFEVPEGYTKK